MNRLGRKASETLIEMAPSADESWQQTMSAKLAQKQPVAVTAAVMSQLCQPSPALAFLEEGP